MTFGLFFLFFWDGWTRENGCCCCSWLAGVLGAFGVEGVDGVPEISLEVAAVVRGVDSPINGR